MANFLKLTILTAEKQFYQGEIKSIKTANLNGRIEILPKHIPMISVLTPTITEFTDREGKSYKLFTSSGILRVSTEEVELLCDACEWPEDVDVKRAEESKARAEERLKNSDKDIDKARAQTALVRAITRLKIRM